MHSHFQPALPCTDNVGQDHVYGTFKVHSFNTTCYFFDVLLTVHLGIIAVIKQLNAQNLVYYKFIICLYMFRAMLCSSSGGEYCIIQHLVSSH